MSHLYVVGERVLYTQHRFPHLTWKAPYTILCCLDTESIEPQYRIRSALRADERVAGEHELTRFALAQQAFRAGDMQAAPDCVSPYAANRNLVPSELRRRAWHENESISAARG
jgi:hypothetical protein